MLRRCLQMTVAINVRESDIAVEATLRAEGVGHRVPTGFVDRNLVLVVEPLDAEGRRLPLLTGPTLPALAGTELAGLPGRLFAKQLQDWDGRSPAPFWRAQPEGKDTRLVPGQAEHFMFRFPAATRQVRARLLYRRFWPATAADKGWPDNETVVMEQNARVPPE
jgi:hypothetical protein